MLSNADRNITEVLDFFSQRGIEVGLLVPTDTALKKSIIDATEPFRAFLVSQGVHDFSLQSQGKESKVVLPAQIFASANESHSSRVSLYRPRTKNGDPRIWFSSLSKLVQPFNLLAVVYAGGNLVVFNVSDETVWQALHDVDSAAAQALSSATSGLNRIQQELLSKLRAIASSGWHKTVRSGPTGVGATLESLLGINANSSKAPDYKGIEIKASRRRNNQRSGLQTLFSKTPNWQASKFSKAEDLLAVHGYIKNGRRQLYCTVNHSGDSNGLGFSLDIVESSGDVWCCREIDGNRERLVVWSMDTLRQALLKKHTSTVWVGAETRGQGNHEEYQYQVADFTGAPMASNLAYWFYSDWVSMDLTLSDKGGGSVRDHGYLFRSHSRNLSKLFPNPTRFILRS